MTSVFHPVMTNLLSVLIFLPLAWVLLLVFLPRENHRLLRNVTFAVTLVEFLLSLPVAILLDGSTAAMQSVHPPLCFRSSWKTSLAPAQGSRRWTLMLTTFL